MNLLKSLGIPGPPPSFWNGNLKERTALVIIPRAHHLFQLLKQKLTEPISFGDLTSFGKYVTLLKFYLKLTIILK